MKRLVLLVMACSAMGWAQTSPTLVASTTVSAGSSYGVTSPINCTGADLLVVEATSYAYWLVTYDVYGNNGTVTDSSGNSWTKVMSGINTVTNIVSGLWFKSGATVSSSLVVTVRNRQNGNVVFACWNTGGNGALDTSSLFQATSSVTSIQPGAVTPALANSLIIAFAVADSAPASSSPTMSLLGTAGIDGNSTVRYLTNQSPAAAINPTWTGANFGTAGIAVFKPAAGSGSPAVATIKPIVIMEEQQ